MYITKGIIVDTGAAYVQDPLYDDKLKIRIPELHGYGDLVKSFQEENYTKDEDLPWCSIVTTKKNYVSIYSILAHKAQSYSPADIVYVQVSENSSGNPTYLVRGTYERYNDGTIDTLTTYNGLDVSKIIESNVEFPEGLLKVAGGRRRSPDDGGGGGGGDGDDLKILLIGNSYTYYNGLGQILGELGAKSGKNYLVVRATKGGVPGTSLVKATLQYYAWSSGKKINKGNATLSKIVNMKFGDYGRKGEWDYIFAQTSAETAAHTETSDIAMIKFINDHKLVTSNKDIILIDLPYAGSTSANYRNYHDKVVKKYKCSIISTRRAAADYSQVYQDKNWQHALTVMDGANHPSARGAYVNALCYYAKLFGVTEFASNSTDSSNYIGLYNADNGNAREFIKNRWHGTKIAGDASQADTVTQSDAIKLQYLIRKNAESVVGKQLFTGTLKINDEIKDSEWKKVSEKNGSTALYKNLNSNIVILGDSRMVQMYNAKKNASYCAVWGGHYGYGANNGLQIDTNSHLNTVKDYIKEIFNKQKSVKIFIVSTVNDYTGGNSGYTGPANAVLKVAKDLYKYISKEKLSVTIYMTSMIPEKNSASVTPYNKKLKELSDSSKYKYINIKPTTVEYTDGTHFTKKTLDAIFEIMKKA